MKIFNRIKLKKFFSAVLGLTLCFSMVLGLSGCAFLEKIGLVKPKDPEGISFTYVYTAGLSGYTITKATNASGKVVVPEYYEIEGKTYPIVAIGDSVFKENKEITEVEIPARVSKIGKGAFQNCTALTKVTFAENCVLETLRQDSFRGCKLLEEFNMPSGVKTIENNVFYGCHALDNIVLPETLTSLGGSAFYECKSLTEIEIPASVPAINAWTFRNCDSLISVYFAEGSICGEIKDYAFRQCGSLTSIIIPSAVKKVGTYSFYACDDLEFVQFGNPDEFDYSQLETINNSAFSECYSLAIINFPASLKSIGTPFHACSSLSTIMYEGTVEEWEYVTKASNWNNGAPAIYLYCFGGSIQLR